MRVFAYIARRYNSAAESASLLSSLASLVTKYQLNRRVVADIRQDEASTSSGLDLNKVEVSKTA